jgi:RNA recognition motif-containing protein
VTSICAKLDKNNLKPFAFVCFETKEQAELAYNELQSVELDNTGEKMYVNWAERKGDRIKKLKDIYSNTVNETNLFTKNLKLGVTQEQLKEAFSVFGPVQSCVLRTPPPLPTPPKNIQENPELTQNKENTENIENIENNENKENKENNENTENIENKENNENNENKENNENNEKK